MTRNHLFKKLIGIIAHQRWCGTQQVKSKRIENDSSVMTTDDRLTRNARGIELK
jgi:hypothetical protein